MDWQNRFATDRSRYCYRCESLFDQPDANGYGN
jgi:hypothetical protein